MPFNYDKKTKYKVTKWLRVTAISLVIGLASAILALALKHLTEHFEEILFEKSRTSLLLSLLFPITGLGAIWLTRHFLFKKRENKGIAEVFESLKSPEKLPAFKIPSHFINGFLTVIFGGATGIEVSTVVATAAIGSAAHRRQHFFHKYRKEMMCAGIAAGITALFNSPLAGILFSLEVISRKMSKVSVVSMLGATGMSVLLLLLTDEGRLMDVPLHGWHYSALPYFALFGVFASVNSVYLTKCVLLFKKKSAEISNKMYTVFGGALLIGIGILALPQLYGDGYHGIKELFAHSQTFSVSLVVFLVIALIVKPILVSVTLSAGGDGGVFAPSLVTGAFAGLLFSICANHFFNAGLIPVNFMLVGMAAVLSASIHAPLTAVFLVCGLIGNYELLVPLFVVSLIAKFSAKRILPYNVYTYKKPMVA